MRNGALWAGLVMLAACSGGAAVDADGDGAITGKEAATAAADIPRPEAGLYRATITMKGIDVPGMGAAMKGHGGGLTTTEEYCLTPADVEQGYQEMLKRGQDGSCRYDKFTVANGAMDAVMLCQTGEGEARVEMKGSVTPTGSQFDASMKIDLDGMGNGTMRFSAAHQRIGDC